jgi:hypothetical protein
MIMTMTPELAAAAAMDAGNRAMRAAGRTVWNEEDCSVAGREFERLWPAPQYSRNVNKSGE